MINLDKVTEIFCLVDEFCNNFENYTKNFIIGNPSSRPPIMSKSDVITITNLFHLSGFRCFKHFYIYYVQKHMKDDFPNTVSYNRFTELMQNNILPLTMFLKTCCLGKRTGISFADSTPVKVCNIKILHWQLTLFYLFYVLSQMTIGYFTTNLRLKYGFFWGLLFHILINASSFLFK